MIITRINGVKVTVENGKEFTRIVNLLLPDKADTIGYGSYRYHEGFCDGYTKGVDDMKNEELYKEAYAKGFEEGLKNADKVTDKAHNDGYAKGLHAAWECARKIGKVNWLTLEKMGFNNKDKEKNPSWDVIMEYSPSEAIAKIKEYEDNEIKVGDEVRHEMGDKKNSHTT